MSIYMDTQKSDLDNFHELAVSDQCPRWELNLPKREKPRFACYVTWCFLYRSGNNRQSHWRRKEQSGRKFSQYHSANGRGEHYYDDGDGDHGDGGGDECEENDGDENYKDDDNGCNFDSYNNKTAKKWKKIIVLITRGKSK